jgi:acyl carrier protein
MVPSTYTVLAELPRLPTGKPDLRALAAPGGARPATGSAYVSPRTPLEEQLVQIWCELLGLDRVGVDDNFMDLGGDSLLAARVAAHASAAFGIDLPPNALFDTPTVAAVASVVAQHMAASLPPETLAQMLAEIEIDGGAEARSSR